jgi:hypothetical protein
MTVMTTDDRAVLDEFLRELGKVIVNKSSAGEAKKKPLLLLLVLAMIKHGRLRENKIQFADVEERLHRLITEYGGRPTDSGPKPEQPFFHLRTSPFWELTIPGGIPAGNKRSLAKKILAGLLILAGDDAKLSNVPYEELHHRECHDSVPSESARSSARL